MFAVAGKHVVRGYGRHDQQVDLLGSDPALLQQPVHRFHGHGAQALVLALQDASL